MSITASDPFRGRCTISREGFVQALRDRPANADCLTERYEGEYYDECCAWGVDPNFLLAMFTHESSMGTAGTAMTTRSWGNTRSPSFGAVPVDLIAGRSGAFPQFASWLDGLMSTAARLASPVWPAGAPYGERTSIQQVFDHPSGAVWAPSSDLNDPDSYLSQMLASMNALTDQPPAPIVATRTHQPPVYSDYIAINYTAGRDDHPVAALVLHVTQGASAGSAIGWFKNPASDVSAHYVIDRDGTIYAVVRESDTAWVNGVVEAPNQDIPIVDWWVTTGVNPNLETIGIEVAGYSAQQPGDAPPHLIGYSDAQFGALAYLLPVLADRHGVAIDPDWTFGHNELSGTQRANCPGLSDDEWDRIYALEATSSVGPYATADAAYDAYCADHADTVVWAGEVDDRAHWYGAAPQPVARTAAARLLAYDGAAAQDATGWVVDDWEVSMKGRGDLRIYGEPPPDPAPDPRPPDPPEPAGPVGAAWPVDPGDGAVGVATDVTLTWGSDAPFTDLEFEQSDGVRIFGVDGTASRAYGPLALAQATTYVWRVRGRDGEHVSDWTEARFGTLHPDPEPAPPGEEKPPKPPSTDPYPPVVTPTAQAAPTATTWRNVSDNKVDLAVSRQWRADCDGGTGPWPDTDQFLNPAFPGAETLLSPVDLRKLTRRLSIHPPIVEAAYRAGLWARVPATYKVDGSQWEDDAATDYGDSFEDMPPHAQQWASQICTLATAIQQAATLADAFRTLGFASAEATSWSQIYHCLRVRVRDLHQLASC